MNQIARGKVPLNSKNSKKSHFVSSTKEYSAKIKGRATAEFFCIKQFQLEDRIKYGKRRKILNTKSLLTFLVIQQTNFCIVVVFITTNTVYIFSRCKCLIVNRLKPLSITYNSVTIAYNSEILLSSIAQNSENYRTKFGTITNNSEVLNLSTKSLFLRKIGKILENIYHK